MVSDVTLGVNSTILVDSGTMQMKGCNVTNGVVQISQRVKEAVITMNRFQDVMFEVSNQRRGGRSRTTIRNNKGKYMVDTDKINKCDQAGIGVGIHVHMHINAGSDFFMPKKANLCRRCWM